MNSGPKLTISQWLHQEKYRDTGEDFRDYANRVAAALTESDDEFRTFRDILLEMRFLPGGRIQAAIGSPRRVTPYNCYVSGRIEDTFTGVNGIMQRATEAAETMRMGGGIGYDFSTLRPKGAYIKSQGTQSSGPVSFMEIFNAICRTVASAGHRRGAQMAVLRVDHPDIEEFISAKHNTDKLTQFNVSIGVTDEFMRAVEEGKDFALVFEGNIIRTVDARALFERIMRSAWDWAEPGILFLDRIREFNNLSYVEEIAATNPCFTGATKVWTADGPQTFYALAKKKEATVLTQDSFGRLVYKVMRNIRMTQENVGVYRVRFDDGTYLDCTYDHVFYTKNRGKLKLHELNCGDSIWSVRRHKANQKGYKRLTNSIDMPLEHHVPYRDQSLEGLHVHHKNRIKWDNRPVNLELIEASKHNSDHILGDLNPARRFPERMSRDTSGKKNGRYRTDIDDEYLQWLREGGLSYAEIAKHVKCSKYTVQKRLGWQRNHKFVSLEYIGDTDVYCGTVDETGSFFIDLGNESGVLVSNCGEQPLPPFGACLLGSFNLTKYIIIPDVWNNATWSFHYGKFEDDIKVVVGCMDRVIDIATYPLSEQEHEAKNKRRMGLGITGFANASEALGFVYGSDDSCNFLASTLRCLRDTAYSTSIDLAKSRGPFPLLNREMYLAGKFAQTLPEPIREGIREHGLRNSHLLSIAPTGTISLCADNISSGIEPVFEYEFERTIQTFDGPVVHKVSDYAFREWEIRGRRTKDVSIRNHLDILTTAQYYIDSAVSKTCNIPLETPWEDFKGLYFDAWKGGCKGITVFVRGGKREGIFSEASACYIDEETGRRECE